MKWLWNGYEMVWIGYEMVENGYEMVWNGYEMVWNGYEMKPTLSKDLLIWFITPVQFYKECYRKSAKIYLSSNCFF